MVRPTRITASLALLAALAGCAAAPPGPSEDTEALLRQAAMHEAKRVLRDSILIDGHNDLPWTIRSQAQGDLAKYDLAGKVPGQTDLQRLKEGGLGAQFWS